MRALLALMLLFFAASAEAGDWGVVTRSLKGSPEGNGMIVHWEIEITNNTAGEEVLHAVLELKGADGAPLKQLETSAVTVTGYGSQTLGDDFPVSPDVWERIKSSTQWVERSAKRPVNWERPSRAKKVELYVTSWCPSCKRAKEWLARNGVEYREYDVERDRAAAARFRGLGGSGGVPALTVDGTLEISGFSEQAYSGHLLSKGKPAKVSGSARRVQPMPRAE